jgi:hypothetical protein
MRAARSEFQGLAVIIIIIIKHGLAVSQTPITQVKT